MSDGECLFPRFSFHSISNDFFRGQNAVNGELGQGEDKPKSATKPLQIETLAELDVLKYIYILLNRRSR
jgi:hypothetical protein